VQVRIYLLWKWTAPCALLLHICLKTFGVDSGVFTDLILYNFVVLAAIVSTLRAPLHSDPFAIAFTSLALASWGIGSTVSSLSEFFNFSENSILVANISYSLFYPFAFLAIPRIFGRRSKLQLLEILDAGIFGLGLSSIVTALILIKFLANIPGDSAGAFFAVLYPVCDIALVVIAVVSAFVSGISKRAFLLISGILIFAVTDFYFLWQQISERYSFGQISDDGWPLGLLLISLSLWSPPNSNQKDSKIHPALIAVSIFISPALLSAIALRPDYFPIYVIVPTITTLFLAFIRMTLVIRQASNLGEEKILARTDELTGLPNRRRLLSEIGALGGIEAALLLLDLDGFKPVNDKYGHEMGDQILRQVAVRFSRALPTGAVLARLGGDEFGVIVLGEESATLELASALKATLSYPFVVGGNKISISVSIGHVRNDNNGDLLQRADAAMYEAKRSGIAIVEAAVYQP
jgi:diguanylate cyclase (GGDEF)-like protein